VKLIEIRRTRKYLRNLADEDGFLYKKGRKRPTLKMWDDGSITRADTSLELCTNMSLGDAYKTLGIK